MKPNKFKLAFLVWCVMYPTVTIIFTVLGDFLLSIHPLLRTAVVTLILVPLMVFVYLPNVMRVFGKWLSK
jgi:antibiotic biosynthesis monooxygenase (ABM) superfamily enzyme